MEFCTQIKQQCHWACLSQWGVSWKHSLLSSQGSWPSQCWALRTDVPRVQRMMGLHNCADVSECSHPHCFVFTFLCPSCLIFSAPSFLSLSSYRLYSYLLAWFPSHQLWFKFTLSSPPWVVLLSPLRQSGFVPFFSPTYTMSNPGGRRQPLAVFPF